MLTETFFIDWERSRGHVIPDQGEEGGVRHYTKVKLHLPVTADGTIIVSGQQPAAKSSHYLAHLHDR